jgi:hypothetical protein
LCPFCDGNAKGGNVWKHINQQHKCDRTCYFINDISHAKILQNSKSNCQSLINKLFNKKLSKLPKCYDNNFHKHENGLSLDPTKIFGAYHWLINIMFGFIWRRLPHAFLSKRLGTFQDSQLFLKRQFIIGVLKVFPFYFHNVFRCFFCFNLLSTHLFLVLPQPWSQALG